MIVVRHRVTCEDCGRFWREGCRDCAEDMAAKHRKETGHQCELTFTQDPPSWEELVDRTRHARMVLYGEKKLGW